MQGEIETSSKVIKDEKGLADTIYVFCPGVDKGIMFFDQSPKGTVAKAAGSLPGGTFWSSGETVVSWDDKINGIRRDDIPVDSQTSVVVNSSEIRSIDSKSSYATTIIVSKEVFDRLLDQIRETPKYDQESGYKVIDLHTRIIRYSLQESNSFTSGDDYSNIENNFSSLGTYDNSKSL